jgi:hypothetical protein
MTPGQRASMLRELLGYALLLGAVPLFVWLVS